MKPFLEVDKTRVSYHKDAMTNTVHRSSLFVPRIGNAKTQISFLNHFLIKRSYEKVACKITAIDMLGNCFSSKTYFIEEARVYNFFLEDVFNITNECNLYLVEFFAHENLFLPFPAVIINHIGEHYINSVHAFNRNLNDIFENDSINRNHVREASIDVIQDDNYDTFFCFCSGALEVHDEIVCTLGNLLQERSAKANVSLSRLNSKLYLLEDYIKINNNTEKFNLLIDTPRQSMFYGRLLTGRINKRTGAFSANHSYYDSTHHEEYFTNTFSARMYPYFNGMQNSIVMYPIMSPGEMSICIKFRSEDGVVCSEKKIIKSPSHAPIEFDITALIDTLGLQNCSAFQVTAEALSGRIPTRVNHQLIYCPLNSKSRLDSSINVSLYNNDIFNPKSKSGFIWGHILIDECYDSYLGICFGNSDGDEEDIELELFSDKGIVVKMERRLAPFESLIIPGRKIIDDFQSSGSIWYVVKSKRSDLTAQCFHYNLTSHNASGEHNF